MVVAVAHNMVLNDGVPSSQVFLSFKRIEGVIGSLGRDFLPRRLDSLKDSTETWHLVNMELNGVCRAHIHEGSKCKLSLSLR